MYHTIALMKKDSILMERISACVATIDKSDPEGWTNQHMWELVTREGWYQAYEKASAPKAADPNGITDSMILEAVEDIRVEYRV